MPTQTRDRLTSEELAVVLSSYDLGLLERVSEFPRGAHGAAKVVIQTDRGKFLLKRRPKGRTDPYRVAFAHALQRYSAEKNYPLPHLIGTREDNNSMVKFGDAVYEMFEYIEGERYDSGLVATYESGKMLGLYHQLVREFSPKWEAPRGHYHNSETVRTAFKAVAEALLRHDPVRARKAEMIDVLSKLRVAYKGAASAANDLGIESWEHQIIHSDWHAGNMLFQQGHVVAVIDYDAARFAPRVLDIANGALQFSMVGGGRDLANWEAGADELRIKRFLRGYDEMNVIAEAELEAAPFLMQEALIAQTIPPILRTGTFAGFDGFEFLQVVLRKVQWLQENRGRIRLEDAE